MTNHLISFFQQNARLELISQKKKKEEQVKREMEKLSRLKKKKELKSSTSEEETPAIIENKSELSKQQEMIFKKKRGVINQHSSSSSESDPVSPGPDLSNEIRQHEIFRGQGEARTVDQTDAKKAPPPVLPKPKPKKKPKTPPTNKSPVKKPAVSQSLQTFATQISQVRLNHVSQQPTKNHPPEVENAGRLVKRQDAVDEDDALYSTVDLASLGYRVHGEVSRQTEDHYTRLDEAYSGANDIRSEKTSNQANTKRALVQNKTPENHVGQDGRNVLQIAPNLGIKEVQLIVNDGTSYSVGENQDVYSLPIKNAASNKDGQLQRDQLQTTHAQELNNGEKWGGHEYLAENEGPYAETALFGETDASDSVYEIPGTFINTSPSSPRHKMVEVNNDLKPPSFKPPPPPPGGSPILENKKNKRMVQIPRGSPTIHRGPSPTHRGSPPTPQNTRAVTSEIHHEIKQRFSRSASDSSNESFTTGKEPEPVYASPDEDNNNNRNRLVTSPKRKDNAHHQPVTSPKPGDTNLGKVPNRHYKNIMRLDMPSIVPPPPSSTPVLDSRAIVVPPPPPMTDRDTSYTPVFPPPPSYPPPRLYPLERTFDVDPQKPASSDYSLHADSQWSDMVQSLPPPHPDLLEINPLYDSVH